MSQVPLIGVEARTHNPALEPLAFLLGRWRTTGTHPALPGKTLRGRTSFLWHEGGAFLIMRSEIDEPQFPSGVAIFASDDSGAFSMSYFDQRGVSRLYQVVVGDRAISWRRDDPELSQTMAIIADGDELVSKGRIAKNGGAWTDDLSQVFERA